VIGVLAIVAQLSIVAHAPDTAQTCEAIEISVAVSGSGHGSQIPRLTVPNFAPFDVLRSSPMPHLTYRSNGGLTAEYRYVLTTDRVGAFNIPAFETRLGNDVARSRPLEIVMRGGTRPNRPIVVARARIDTSLEVKTSALALPETVFVGQQANYEVAVFLNETVRERLRRNPTFFPPDMQSMLAYDLPARGDAPRRQASSHCFDALVYQRALFPLMPGRFAIPPAQLVYSLPLSASFFAREETHELQTDSTVLIAVEPPVAGRPADYGGAVGNLHVAAKLDTVGSRVGDPVTLTVRVSGTGNVKLFPRPSVGVDWASLVKGDERVQVDTLARKIVGAKEFDWVLTPKIAGELDLPPIKYTFFNPETRRYETTSTTPTHLRVAPGSLASADTARTDALLSLRTRYRGAPSTPLHEHPEFWIVLALLPLPAVSIRAKERRARRPAKAMNAAERLSKLAHDEVAARDACEVRRIYTMALGERLGLSPESFTRSGALARALRRRGVSTDVALDAERFLRQLDEAAFSASGTLAADSAVRANQLYETVDEEALPLSSISGSSIAIICLVLVAVGVATAEARDDSAARQSFDAGVAAYNRHDFATARDAFAATVRDEPKAPDGWANLGTAAWAVADTAKSVAAWQRALRMEPLANDVRERVELAHSLPLTAAGYVPPMPASWVFDLAALLWLGAWGVAAYRASTGRNDDGREIALVAIVAGMVAIGGFVISERLAGRHIAVVRQTAALRAEPDLASDTDATAITGEVVRVAGRQGAWSRVVLDDGRDGWLSTDSVLSLDEREGAAIAAE
jgi:hypothetical protein